jgi:hypothetical protein
VKKHSSSSMATLNVGATRSKVDGVLGVLGQAPERDTTSVIRNELRGQIKVNAGAVELMLKSGKRFYCRRARVLQVLPMISRWVGLSPINSNP